MAEAFEKAILASLIAPFIVGSTEQTTTPRPQSDPENTGNWIYNEAISDEFDGEKLDEDRWFIVGKFVDGKPSYLHPDDPARSVWKGRAPSQFSGRNYRLQDGKLILEARWEPDFPFEKEIRQPNFGKALPYENITTPSLIQRRQFTYGYMETRAKVADAQINSAFWTIGKGLEIDIFEIFGNGRKAGTEHLDTQLWWSIRDWDKLRGQPAYTERRQIGFRPADDFHIYGLEWNPDSVRYFLDGKLIADITADEVRKWARENNQHNPKVDDAYDGWVANRPVVLWLDMETFPWHGVPESAEDLERSEPEPKRGDAKVEFEVDYVRLWQRAK